MCDRKKCFVCDQVKLGLPMAFLITDSAGRSGQESGTLAVCK